MRCAHTGKTFDDLGYAKPDHQRAERQGAGEVVYGEGKTAAQIAGICRSLRESGQERVLVTRLDEKKARELIGLMSAPDAVGAPEVSEDFDTPDLREAFNIVGAPEDPEALGASGFVSQDAEFSYFPEARLGVLGGFPEPDGNGTIVVAAAGTSDLFVAEEAALTAEFLGNRVIRLYDVGVAGVHRLLAYEETLTSAQVIVAVAGMEGALPSVVGGLVSCPVIAVPTSVGYGASFGGVTALLAMLNSCASGVSVVNIDNGFGGGYQASLINHLAAASA